MSRRGGVARISTLAEELLGLWFGGRIEDLVEVLELECTSRLGCDGSVFYRLLDGSVLVSCQDGSFTAR